ncbi:hypothetical protein [Burkholderia cepacia]|uniref:hypothetical protein n=1 Tax=Burkholderia cepacia TaxID=292 RepID=UPI00075DED19|nr:hypothetical protein [Burkholderia cepacia]KVK90322.1 hypothetical protein WS93_35850 [Burkholderia cepacia]
MKSSHGRVTGICIAAIVILAAATAGYTMHVREIQREQISRDAQYVSRSVEKVLRMDRTRREKDVAAVENSSGGKYSPRTPPRGVAALLESDQLNDLFLAYAEDGLRTIQLITKKNDIESRLLTATTSNIYDPKAESRWNRRTELRSLNDELRPVADDLVQALLNVQKFGERIQDRIGDIRVPTTEIRMGLHRYASLPSSSGQ